MEIRRAAVAEVRPLQSAVLRPDGPLPGDSPPPDGWWHFAALGDGRVVGAVSVGPARWPVPELVELSDDWWQLRSLAVAPGSRGLGIGSALLGAVRGEAAAAGIGGLWAAARLRALRVYTTAGWHAMGPVWDKPGVGPHRYVCVGLDTQPDPPGSR